LQSLFDCEINSWQSFPGHITAPNQVISNPTDDSFFKRYFTFIYNHRIYFE
jgi:hypothetical protein